MTSTEIRKSFLDFFSARGHRIVPSAPVIPQGDPTLLFTNAGMNQFKDVFLGTGTRDYSRAADTQKCIRVSGKHNDLEEVGHDTYHHTLFEMLGNWSFADYGKKEAISWAWELLTEVWKLPKDRLYATVFRTDEEAHKLWSSVTDIDPSHIMRFDEKDNFWEMGETGPCGPCSEIHIDLTETKTGGSLVNKGSAEVIELWNLVFIQYNRNALGELDPLPNLFVDTGMGFERVCAVMQGKKSNYESDVFTPLLKKIGELCGTPYEKFPHNGIEQISMRVMSDHIRTLTFAIADGAIPSNEDRGYVLRRILRRASRYARNLNLHEPSLFKLVQTLVDQMSAVFPEIREKQNLIERVVKAEEESFNITLDRGIELFNDIAARTNESESPIITGEEAFKLYDTFGFPLDLTVLMAKEREMSVDMDGFEKLMEGQRRKSKKASRDKIGIPISEYVYSKGKFSHNVSVDAADGIIETMFVGYASFESQGRVLVSAPGWLTLDKSPFYTESGGQISDTGSINLISDGNKFHVIKIAKNGSSQILQLEEYAKISVGSTVIAEIDIPRRLNIQRNHTATHLVHEALRRVVGTHLHQQGSLVAPDRLRFDFNHFEKITDEQLRDIEQIVNGKIREGIPIVTEEMSIDEAKKIPNVKMFFGDKYGDEVRVVICDENYSVEFCGGTHVKNSADIGYFKFIAEAGIASGMRRIEAVTGFGADEILQYRYHEIDRLSKRLNVSDRDLYNKVDELLEEKKHLEKELSKLKLQSASGNLDSLIATAQKINNVASVPEVLCVVSRIDNVSAEELKTIGDTLRTKLTTGIGVLATVAEEKIHLVCVVTDDLSKKISAGKLVGAIAKQLGGSGGGRPTLATGGGKDVAKLDEVLRDVTNIIVRGV